MRKQGLVGILLCYKRSNVGFLLCCKRLNPPLHLAPPSHITLTAPTHPFPTRARIRTPQQCQARSGKPVRCLATIGAHIDADGASYASWAEG